MSAVTVSAVSVVGRLVLDGLGDDRHLGLGVNEGGDPRRRDEGQRMRVSEERDLSGLVDNLNRTLLG